LTPGPIVSHAILYGVILGGVVFPLILAAVRINPEIMLDDYPQDIKAKYGPMSERSKRQRIPFAALVIIVWLGVVVLSFQGVAADLQGAISFTAAFLHLFVMFSVFNLLDWLVFDWLIVVTLRPAFIILPGTEGMAGYADYGFHFRGFLIGMAITVVTSLLAAGGIALVFTRI